MGRAFSISFHLNYTAQHRCEVCRVGGRRVMETPLLSKCSLFNRIEYIFLRGNHVWKGKERTRWRFPMKSSENWTAISPVATGAVHGSQSGRQISLFDITRFDRVEIKKEIRPRKLGAHLNRFLRPHLTTEKKTVNLEAFTVATNHI